MEKTYTCNFIASGCDAKLVFNGFKYDGYYALALGEESKPGTVGESLNGKEATVVNVKIGIHVEYDVMIDGRLWERMPAEIFDLYKKEEATND